jgi:hypothetical protein
MDINFISVFLAALSAFFLGFFWYTIIFAKVWQKEIGLKDNGGGVETPNLGRLLIGSLILEIIMAFTLAVLIGDEADWVYGLSVGLAVGLGCVGFAFGVNYMFEGKSLKLWFINAAYNTVVFSLMGLIIGAM